ncbi:MAG TPA: SprT family zinc-dependent metalloprotease [Burkholderiales bacterium]
MSAHKDLQLPLPLPFREREFVAPARAVINGRLVTYTIKRSSRRRTISLRIDEAGLRVGAPIAATQRAIENALQTHGAWILGKLAEWSGRRPPVRQWTDGALLMLHGEPLALRCTADMAWAEVRGDVMLAPARDTERGVIAALRDAALDCYRGRVAHYCDALGVEHPDVRLSNARTRWGSCHIEGRIRLNWRMIQMPMRLIDYVVAHEVAHLREMNHSARFWAIVGRLIPDYITRRKEIRTEGHRYLVV